MSKGDLFGNSAIIIEPTAEMREAGLVTRQLFLGYVQAGFNEVQAMQLVLEFIRNSTGGNK